MASASVSTAVSANPGAFRDCRKASRISAFMLPPCHTSSAIFLRIPGLYRCTQVLGRRFRLMLPVPGPGSLGSAPFELWRALLEDSYQNAPVSGNVVITL